MNRPLDLCLGAAAVTAALAVALACGGPPRRSSADRLLEGAAEPDPATEQACRLTAIRCTACHDIDRVLAMQPAEPLQWNQIIGRMRRMRGSGISQQDGDQVLRCLVFRSFGAGGLRAIEAPAAAAPDVVDEPGR